MTKSFCKVFIIKVEDHTFFKLTLQFIDINLIRLAVIKIDSSKRQKSITKLDLIYHHIAQVAKQDAELRLEKLPPSHTCSYRVSLAIQDYTVLPVTRQE